MTAAGGISVPIFALGLIAGSLLMWGQSDRGSITGRVTDPSGAVIPDAPVVARNLDNGALYQSGTSGTGNYTLPQLPTGSYQLTVTVTGFKTFVRERVTVPVAQTVRIDIALEVGTAAEVVTVTDTTPLLQTESAEVSHAVESASLNQLPVLAFGTGTGGLRSPFQSANLIPGSSFNQDSAFMGGVRINGLPTGSQAFRIEGQDSQSTIWASDTGYTIPSVDAIQEVSIQTSNFAAEFGMAGGGVFNTTMKSGTNQYHGSAFNYMANEAFNAGTPNTSNTEDGKPLDHVRNRLRRNDYGATFGGPIRIPGLYDGRDRSFFFFSFEQYRETQVIKKGTTQSFQTVPIPAFREGDFSSVLGTSVIGKDQLGNNIYNNQIFDVCTETRINGIRSRAPFPGNKIPVGTGASCLPGGTYLDPVALKLQSFMPEPDAGNTALWRNRLVNYSNPKLTTAPSIKLDQNLSANSKLSGYWAWNSIQNPGYNGVDAPLTSQNGQDYRTHTIRLNYDYTISPTMLLHVGAGYLHTNRSQVIPNIGNIQDLVGFKGAPVPELMLYITGLSNGSFGGWGQTIGSVNSATLINHKPTGNVSLTWVRDNHTMKFGGELVIEGYPMDSTTYGNPWVGPSRDQISTPAAQNQQFRGGAPGFQYASFLLGNVNEGYIAPRNKTRIGKHAVSFFAQDTWKVTRKFTLDYGLRYDYQTYLKEHAGYLFNLGPFTPNPSVDNRLGATIYEATCGCNFSHNYPHGWGPRLAGAYQINDKTVLRVGVGVTYTRTAANNLQSYSSASTTRYAPAQFGDPTFLLREGINIPVVFPNLDPGIFPFRGVPAGYQTFFDRNGGRPARTVQWSLMLQREIARNLTVEAGYVANRGAWFQAVRSYDANALQESEIAKFGLSIHDPADRTLLGTTQIGTSAAAARGFGNLPYSTFPTGQTVGQALRPFPQFTSINHKWAPLGSTWYDSLQVKLTKRYSHGLDLSSNFTWSRSLANGSATETQFGSGVGVNDVFNRGQNKYLSVFDQPFVFVLSASYQTPAWEVNPVVAMFTRNWQVSTVLRYQSGQPRNTPTSNNQIGNQLYRQGGATYMNRSGAPLFLADQNCKCFDPSQQTLLNPDAWANPAPGEWGTGTAWYTDNRQIRAPQENMSLARNFRLQEDGVMNLQLRMEFTNVFNRWSWPEPGNNPFAATVRDSNGNLQSGFGVINLQGGARAAGQAPRAGVFVARLTF